jgi:hypothetical protein
MISGLQVMEIGHIVWTATFCPIFQEVFVNYIFRTSSKRQEKLGTVLSLFDEFS